MTISIATKDRLEVLNETLRKIHNFGLGDCPLIVCDDGSEPALMPEMLSLFPKGRLIRNERPQGQALARNRIARECHTPFLLQLDDDSYPVGGDVREACEELRRSPVCIALGLSFEEPRRKRFFTKGQSCDTSIHLRAFVGCAVLWDVTAFLSLNGYAEWIGATGEEDELALRAFAAGKKICFSDALRIRHEVTDTRRDENGISFRSFRNWTWIWRAHAPIWVLPVRLSLLGVRGLASMIWRRNTMAMKGIIAGLENPRCGTLPRTPLRLASYRFWLSLPHHLDMMCTNETEGSDTKAA